MKTVINAGNYSVGGGLLLGNGVGFFYLEESALYFIGSTIVGLGIGLILKSLMLTCKNQ